jgi:hypothetical protein
MALTYVTIPLLYSNMLPYTFIYIEIVFKSLYSSCLCLVTLLFYKIVMVPHYTTKMSLAMTYLLETTKEVSIL